MVSVALTIGILEIGFRLFADTRVRAGIYLSDERLHHVHPDNLNIDLAGDPPELPPFSFKTNELGLKIGEPYQLAKPRGVKRIVVCGDSFIQGFDYRHSIPAQLERALAPHAAAKSIDIEVINAGVGSYSPMIHYFALRYKILQLKPDAVILAIDATDAYDDAFRYQKCLYTDQRGEFVGVRSKIEQRARLLRTSMVQHLPMVSLDFWIAAMSPYSAIAKTAYLKNLETYAQRHGHLIEPTREEFFPYMDADNPGTREWIEYSQLWVERIIQLLRERKINVMIAVYPHPVHLEIPRLQRSFGLWEEFAQSQGVLFHDATPAFLREPDYPTLFFSDDIHYNYKGQKVWADDLNEYVITHLDVLFDTPSESSQ